MASMIQKIEWHEECLKNTEIYLKGKRDEEEQILKLIRRLENHIAFGRMQIEEAKKRGMTAFDGTRFLRKQRKVES